jgi:hypothetical protein
VRATGLVPALTAASIAYWSSIINTINAQRIMSDSGADRPSEQAIATKLRDIVIAIHKSGKSDDLTVKRVRARAAQELGLDEGFFKTDSTWKEKSQKAIVDAVV